MTTTNADEAVITQSYADEVTIRSWTWRPPPTAGEAINLVVEADAGRLRDRVKGEAEIARTVALFERSLRAALARPDQGVVLKNSRKMR